jgi:hypothetical protein
MKIEEMRFSCPESPVRHSQLDETYVLMLLDLDSLVNHWFWDGRQVFTSDDVEITRAGERYTSMRVIGVTVDWDQATSVGNPEAPQNERELRLFIDGLLAGGGEFALRRQWGPPGMCGRRKVTLRSDVFRSPPPPDYKHFDD